MSIEGCIIYNMYHNNEDKTSEEVQIKPEKMIIPNIQNDIEKYVNIITEKFKNIINFEKYKKID